MRLFAGFWIALCLVAATHAKSITETELFAGDQGKCDCENGLCIENDKGEYVCTCPPEWGLYKVTAKTECRKCNCGKDSNCTFDNPNWIFDEKKCLCKAGYEDKYGICKVSTRTCDREKPYCLESNGVCVEEEEGKVNCMCESGRYYFANSGCTRLCDCKNGWCIKDDEFDNYRCTCAPEWGLVLDEHGITAECKKCNCGKDSLNCTFTKRYKAFTDGKRCICKVGYADKDGICEKCDCGGPNSKKVCLGFSWDGKIICKCPDGYSDNDGKCEECRCGDTSRACIFVDGEKTCKCKDGLSENNGICKKCRCGETSRACKFADGEKICECKDGFSDNQGFCFECLCGENSESCKYVNGRKTCKCKDGFSDNDGTCVGILPSISDTTQNLTDLWTTEGTSDSDWFNSTITTAQTTADIDVCKENPCQNGGTCLVVGNTSKCVCRKPYLGILCETDPCALNPCKNGGLCKVENETIACFCKQPFAGEFCESPTTSPGARIDVYVITLIAGSVFLAVVLLFVTCVLCQRFHVTK